MKVLHLIDSGGLYGAEKMLLNLVEAQLEQGLDPMILSAGERGISEKPLEIRAQELGFPITPWRMNPGLNFREIRRIWIWAKENGYQVAHSHGYKFDILLGLLPRAPSDPRFVATVHGYTATSLFSKLGLYQLLDRIFLKRADGVAVVSSILRNQFRNYSNVWHIPNGISATNGDLPVRAENPEDTYFLSLGRLSPEKAVDRLIRAYAALDDGVRPKKLVIAGEGPEKEKLEHLVQCLELRDSVVFIGYVQDPLPLLRGAHALAISSITEGLPITLLEAMSLEIPVIATPVGDIPTTLESGKLGYLAESTDWNHLKCAMLEMLSDTSEARRKAGCARQYFFTHYTGSAMAEKYRNFYDHLAFKKEVEGANL